MGSNPAANPSSHPASETAFLKKKRVQSTTSKSNFDTISEVSLGRECDFHHAATEGRVQTTPSPSSSQQSLGTRPQVAPEDSSPHPELRDGISLQRDIPKGTQDTLRWEPPPSSPTGSTCSNSLTGFQECSLEPVNKGLSK